MLASSFLDPVLGIDIHFEMVPTPAPVPLPIPNPFIGLVFDPIGLACGIALGAAIITGASRGVGKQAALDFAKRGAKVVLAEAEIPRAMAEAFRNGNLGLMDYYRMRNIEADTTMRSSIAGGDKPQKGPNT